MSFGQTVFSAFQGPTGIAIWGIAVLGAVEFVSGILKAWSAGQFQWSLVDVWVRTQLAGRILPIVLVLVAGSVAPDFTVLGLSVNPLVDIGMIGAAAYAAAALVSIKDNVTPSSVDTPPTE